MTTAEFRAKWHDLFPDNITGQISETRMREFVSDMVRVFAADATPEAPEGVSWNRPPSLSISGNQITATDAEAQNGADTIAIPSKNVTVVFAANSMKRKDIFGAFYLADLPAFGTITGSEVALNAIAFSPVIPDGFLPLSYLDVTDGSITQQPTGSEKFKGKWAEGIYDADTYFLTATGIWRVKRKHGSAAPPTIANDDVELVFEGGNGPAGADGKSAVIGYADDATGTGYSSSPAGKKYIAVKAASTTDTINAAFFAGLWQPWSNNVTSGAQAGSLINFFNEFQARTTTVVSATVISITSVSNEWPGKTVFLELDSKHTGDTFSVAIPGKTVLNTGFRFVAGAINYIELTYIGSDRFHLFINPLV